MKHFISEWLGGGGGVFEQPSRVRGSWKHHQSEEASKGSPGVAVSFSERVGISALPLVLVHLHHRGFSAAELEDEAQDVFIALTLWGC